MITNKETVIRNLISRRSTQEFQKKKYDLFRDDKEIALLAVSTSRMFMCDLNNLSDRLRDDLDVVKAAVTNRNDSIMAASERIRTLIEDEFQPGNAFICDLPKDKILNTLDRIGHIESKGLAIPEGKTLSEMEAILKLSDDLKCNLKPNINKKTSRLKL